MLVCQWLAALEAAPGEQKSAKTALPAGVAATVNGRPLPQKIVDSFLKNGQAELQLDPKTDDGRATLEKLRAAIIDEQIERLLIAEECERRKIAPTKAVIDAAERNTMELHGDQESYQRFLAENGFTREEYREFVLGSAARGAALKAAQAQEVSIADDEIQKFYEQYRTDPAFQSPERVTGLHILFNTQAGVLGKKLEVERGLKPGTPELLAAIADATERQHILAEKVRLEAAGPQADFAALAQKYSEDSGTRSAGGSLGTFAKGAHLMALDEPFFALKPGEVGPVVQTEYGFHVIKAMAHLPAGQQTLSEATQEIRRRLLRIAAARAARDWLQKARADAKIVVRSQAKGS